MPDKSVLDVIDFLGGATEEPESSIKKSAEGDLLLGLVDTFDELDIMVPVAKSLSASGSLAIPIIKKKVHQRHATAIVMEPGVVDAHKETASAETIEKAAHDWMMKSQKRGLMHKIIVNGDIKVLESWIAPVTMKVNGRTIKKGSWVATFFIVSKTLWKNILKGVFTGVSIGGRGRKKPLP